MSSPFPGMDPYLEDERFWPAFQHQLVSCLYQILLPGLVDRYRARVGQRQYTTEQVLFTSIVREEHVEEYIEIRQRSDRRVVTVVDLVSPANKLTSVGRSAYLDKRREGKGAGANLVEGGGTMVPANPYDSRQMVDHLRASSSEASALI